MQHCKFDLDYITEASVISNLTFNPFTFYPLRLSHYAAQRTNNNWECNSIIAVLQEENKLRNNLSDDITPLFLFSSALAFIHEEEFYDNRASLDPRLDFNKYKQATRSIYLCVRKK